MEKYITLLGDDEKEIKAEILFTFKYDYENYVLLTFVDEIDGTDSEYDVLAYKYEELESGNIGNLIEIADGSSDWNVVEEMLNTFQEGKFSQDEKE